MCYLRLAIPFAACMLAVIGCRTEIGGITSINEVPALADDPSVTFFTGEGSTLTRWRGSRSSIRTTIVGRLTLVRAKELDVDDLRVVRIVDNINGTTHELALTPESFAHDLCVYFDDRDVEIILDVELPRGAWEIRDENIVQYGPAK